MGTEKRQIIGAGVLLMTIMFGVWLLPGWWNLGFSLVNTVFLLLILSLYKRIRNDRVLMFFWLASLGLGWFETVRNYEVVRLLSIGGVLILNNLTVAMARKKRAWLSLGRVVGTNSRAVWGMLGAVKSMIKMLPIERFKHINDLGKIVIGVVASIPLLYVFGILFYGADPIFAQMIDNIKWPEIKIDAELMWKMIWTVMFFGASASLIQSKLAKRMRMGTKKWGQVTEGNVALGILEILFAIFAVVQIRYFLVSDETLRSMGIIYSEYTRRGYSEMIVASILAFGAVFWLERRARQSKISRWLSLLMALEILIFVISATKRNYWYQNAYGFTRIRLLGFWLSGWLATMVGLIMYKIQKRKGTDFYVRGVIVVTAVAMLGMNLFNIDRTIVMAKPANLGKEIDYKYLADLSVDAWGGWEMILKYTEGRIAKGDINTVGDIYGLKLPLNILVYKMDYLKNLKQNNWHNGGSWNKTTAEAENYLRENLERINTDITQLDEINNRIKEEMKQEETKKLIQIQSNLLNQFRIINVFQNITLGDVSKVNTNPLITAEVNDSMGGGRVKMDEIVRGASAGKCWLTINSGYINTKKTAIWLYAVQCRRDY